MNSLPIGGMAMRIACGTIDPPQDPPVRHPERAPCELLARVDGHQAGADDLRQIRGFVQRQRDPAAMNGVNHDCAKPLQNVGSTSQTK